MQTYGLTLRSALFILVCASANVCGGVTIRPEGPVVVSVGNTIRFHAGGSVTWSLEPGSAGTIDPDGTYHAPKSIPVKNSLGGCQMLPNDHIYNTRIDSLPLDPKSAYFVSLIPPAPVGYFEGWGTNFSDRETPVKKMHFYYTPRHDGVFELVSWPELKRQGGVFNAPKSGQDRHQVSINRDTCRAYELYDVYDPGMNSSCATCTAQSGVQYGDMDIALQGSVDAAGLLLTPLTLNLAEIRSGAVQHALRMTLRNQIISPTSVWPATSHAGAWGRIPYGTRFRLKSSYDISKFSDTAKVLLRQLQQYGLIIADGGADWAVSTSTDLTLDPVVMAALDEVAHKGPRSNEFEVVDESSLMLSPDSGLVKSDNGHMKPDSFATVIATDAQGKTARVRVLLRGVTVGTPDPSVWIQSGVTEQLKGWVNGTENRALKWSMQPALGTLTPEGRYTAPEVTRPTQTMITASSVADPNAKAQVALTVMPPGPIRVKIGNAPSAAGAPNHFAPDYGPDSEGHMWWRDQAGEVSWGVSYDNSYGEVWPKENDMYLYYTSRYSFGDMVYKFFVPNGKYKITLLFAQPGDHGAHATYPKSYRFPIHLEAQGKLLVRDYDMGAGIGYLRKTPVVESLPAEVTDQSLYFALRRVTLPNVNPSPLFNGYVIERDTSPPHISVIPSKVTSLHIGDQIQFKALGWSLPDAVRWTVAKGRGSISADGLYTAPSDPPVEDEPIVIEARSEQDGTKGARAEMVLHPGDMTISPSSAAVPRGLTQQFKAAISGATYSNVSWSITPKVGTINVDGLYTAPDQLKAPTMVTVKAVSKAQQNRSADATMNLQVVPDTIRVNCGGGEFRDAKGNVWAADEGYNTGMIANTKVPIPNVTPDMAQLYQSSRYVYPNDKFSYHFAVPNGRYKVTLKFSDYVYDTPGHHVFDVKINGETVLTNFDANAQSVPRAAIDKAFETSVKDKSITIEFVGHAGGAIINGLEIQYTGSE